jgi:hypothetical protein
MSSSQIEVFCGFSENNFVVKSSDDFKMILQTIAKHFMTTFLRHIPGKSFVGGVPKQ